MARAFEGTVNGMTRRADAVVTGRIVSMHEGQEAVVEVLSAEKGDVPSQIVVTGEKGFGTSWRDMINPLVEGATYVLFLRGRNGTYMPAAGIRSFFRVTDNSLVQGDDSPSGYTLSSIKSEVSRSTNP